MSHSPTLRDTGLKMQVELLEELRSLGQAPPVLDARRLLLDPRGVFYVLCQRLSIPFDDAMLSWPVGPRPEDGRWAKHWCQDLHRSTGFARYQPKTGALPDRLRPLLAECQPLYDLLAGHHPTATRPPP